MMSKVCTVKKNDKNAQSQTWLYLLVLPFLQLAYLFVTEIIAYVYAVILQPDTFLLHIHFSSVAKNIILQTNTSFYVSK